MKTSKKILSTLLATTMAVGMAMPAFAGDKVLNTADSLTAADNKTTITGTTQSPTIKVTIPESGGVIVNPYKMEVDASSLGAASDAKDQIISGVQWIKNESDVALQVKATVTGTPASGVTLASAALKGNETTKSVFMYVEFASGDGTDAPSWGTYDAKAVNFIPVSAKATTKTVGTLAAGDSSATYLGFHLAGSAASNAATAWTSADTVAVEIAYTFTPTTAE